MKCVDWRQLVFFLSVQPHHQAAFGHAAGIGASLYRWVGGGTNSSGTSIETGFGFGGGSFDYTYSDQIAHPGGGW